MPGPPRRSSAGCESYARAISRVSCAQIIYAQAERAASSSGGASTKPSATGGGGASSSAGGATPGTPSAAGVTPRSASRRDAASGPVAPSSVHASDAVADALADVAAAFVGHVGARAAARAELAGRTRVALPDVLAILRGLAPVTQSHMRDLARYALLEEIPFPVALREFPAPVGGFSEGEEGANGKEGPGSVGIGRGRVVKLVVDPVDADELQENGGQGRPPAPPWIEAWMPPLPPGRTYKSTPGVILDGAGAGTGPGGGASAGQRPDRTLLSTQRRQVEQSLARLKGKHVAGSDADAVGTGAVGALGGVVSSSHALAENPFLAPPKIGAARIIDEDMVRGSRDVTEPVEVGGEGGEGIDGGAESGIARTEMGGGGGGAGTGDGDGDVVMRDSNVASSAAGAGEPSDPKRARVMRILNGSSGPDAQG